MSGRRPKGARFRLRPVRLAIAVAVAAGGLWIGAQALGAHGRDAAALGIRSRDLLGAGDRAGAVATARAALRRDPSVVTAVQTLGLAAEAGDDRRRADRLLAYADRLTRRDLQTHLWAIEHDVARGDTDAALREYDLALRTSEGARDLLFPVLSGAVAGPQVARGLVRRLAGAPAWRDDFIAYMAGDPQVAPAQAAAFLGAARRAGVPVSVGDIAALTGRAIDTGDLASAWRAYVLAHPGAGRGGVRDPTFAAITDTPTAFDWTASSEGGIVAVGVAGDGGQRLSVEAGPGTAGVAIVQTQLLPPGRYRLDVDAGSLSQGGGFVWTLGCRGGPELARLPLTDGPARRYASAPFTIAAGCMSQRLELSVDASAGGEALRGEIRRVAITGAAG